MRKEKKSTVDNMSLFSFPVKCGEARKIVKVEVEFLKLIPLQF